MSEAVLIIYTPINCYECELNNYHFCDVTGDSIEEYTNTEYRPDWCPLKELPEEWTKEYKDDYGQGFTAGWNACRNNILGK